MFTKNIIDRIILSRRTMLCVGLDTDPDKCPEHITGTLKQKVLEFNIAIVRATAAYCVAYKINTAFYEAMGSDGWHILKQTAEYIKSHYSAHFLIADAKRGDIGNTANQYARAFYDEMPFDAVTLSPYMGLDTIRPFIREGKFSIILALTSNQGSMDFQMQPMSDGSLLFENVVNRFSGEFSYDQIMFVAGATHGEVLRNIRASVPDYYLLVPGVGAQGGDYSTIVSHALNSSGAGLLVNSSREILYASSSVNFEEAAASAAMRYLF